MFCAVLATAIVASKTEAISRDTGSKELRALKIILKSGDWSALAASLGSTCIGARESVAALT
jgi:hypothetical protein